MIKAYKLSTRLSSIENQKLTLNYMYYLCEMVVQVRDLLIAKNIPFENIISEIYF